MSADQRFRVWVPGSSAHALVASGEPDHIARLHAFKCTEWDTLKQAGRWESPVIVVADEHGKENRSFKVTFTVTVEEVS